MGCSRLSLERTLELMSQNPERPWPHYRCGGCNCYLGTHGRWDIIGVSNSCYIAFPGRHFCSWKCLVRWVNLPRD